MAEAEKEFDNPNLSTDDQPICGHRLGLMFEPSLQATLPFNWRDNRKAFKQVCPVIAGIQLLLFIIGLTQFGTTVQTCQQTKFASYVGTGGVCKPEFYITDEFNLDDSGYWDTKNKFASAKSMVKGSFHQYSSDNAAWRGIVNKASSQSPLGVGATGISKDFYKVLSSWNEQFQVWGTAQTLVAMVTSSQTVSHTASTVEVQLNADPVSLMNTEHYRIQAAAEKRTPGAAPYGEATYQPRQWYYSDKAWAYLDLGMTDFLLRGPSDFANTGFTVDTPDRSDDDETTTDPANDYLYKTFPVTDDNWQFPTPRPTTQKTPTQKPVTSPPTARPTVRPIGAPTVRPSQVGWNVALSAYQDDETITSGTVDFRMNKYSLWVAAAVNMGTIDVSDLLTLDSDTEYTSSNRDDDPQRRRSLTEQRMSSEQRRAKVDLTKGPTFAAKTEQQDSVRSESSRRLNMHSGSWGDRGKSFAYPGNLQPMVYRKFEDKMDPVWCTLKNETRGSYCWLNVGHGDDESNEYGVNFFPLIQHYDPACLKCKKYGTDAEQTAFDDACNTFDLEFLLLFDAYSPYKPYYANFNQSDHYHYDILTVARKGMTKSGFTGYLSLNLYNTGYKHAGHTYLNDLFYALPDTQCTMPIAIAASSSKNVQACGTTYADEAIQEKTKNARGKYCFIPPEAPIFRCAPSGWTCFSQGLAAAWSLVGFFNAFWVMMLITWLSFCSPPSGEDTRPSSQA
jgi:hypothetical protein